MTNIDERAEFEKWHNERNAYYRKIHLKIGKNLKRCGYFDSEQIKQIEYEAWQVRATLPKAGNNHIAVIRKMVNRQAEDEGLWFDAKYASEAYLQKALRKLHAVIESVPPEPTAEVHEYEVVRIMAEGMEPTYSDTYSSRELIEKALHALSDNGYKVVRK
jgi:hypothetical protein